MKKISVLLLTACILLTLFNVSAFAFSENKKDGPFSYYIENGYAVINDYDGSVSGKLVIPEKLGGYPVGGITRWKFQRDTKITSLVLPEGFLYLGELAFSDCSNLAEVTIPDSLCGVGRAVFSGTPWYDSLPKDGDVYIGNVLAKVKDTTAKEITVKDGTTGIADYLFISNTTVEKVKLPDSCVYIGEYAFLGCTALKEIDMPEKAIYIGQYAFSSCSALKKIELPEGIPYISNALLQNASALEEVIMPEGIAYIGDGAFANCALKSVVIPEGTQSIDAFAFSKCAALSQITLPESLKIIESQAFSNCSGLKKLNYNGTDEEYSGIVIEEKGNESLIALKPQSKELQKNILFVPCTYGQDMTVYPRGFSVADYIECSERRQSWGSSYENLLEAVVESSLKEKGLLDVAVGDADKNGKIDASDARTVLRASVGLEKVDFERIYLGDIDNDKLITSSDARLVLRASVGLEDAGSWK